MTPDSSQEVHLRTIAELAIMRILLTSLCRQSPDARALLADFEQSVEEQRHLHEVTTGQKDQRFESCVALYSKAIRVVGDIPPQTLD